MAIARNESLARMIMFLCFGTAILSLAVHGQNMRTKAQLNPSVSTTVTKNSTSLTDSSKNISPGLSIGETALGASFPSSASNSTAGKKYLVSAADRPKSTKLGIPEQIEKHNTKDKPKGFFFGHVDDSKSVERSGSTQTEVVVDLSDRRVYVYRYDQVIASYPIAIGKKGWETPTGNFQVIHKEHHPIWKHPITGKIYEAGTDSPLGDRWIGFWSDGRNEIGFHGTPNTDLIGGAVSHGCLRMRNPDVRMLYEQVDLGTIVLVRD